jgi:peptide/nickel transport system substrate-binding protein
MKISHLIPVLFLFIYACKPQDSNDLEQQIFHYNEYSNISSLDPAFSKNQAHIWAVNQLFNNLVRLDDNLEIIPDLAKSWSISEDGMIYEFSLREDVFFHEDPCFENGSRAFEAQDVVYSFNQLRSSELAAPGAWVLKDLDTVYSLSKHRVRLVLNKAFPPFLGLLSMKYCSILPHEAVEYYGAEFRKHPVGTGPFYLKFWEENVKMVMRRNNSYFRRDEKGRDLPYLEAVNVSFLPDKQSEFLQLVQGNLEMLSGLDPSYKDEILTIDGELTPRYEKDFVLLTGPYLNTEYLGVYMDDSSSILMDQRVRKALSYGFDRSKMIRFLRNNRAFPAYGGMIPKGLPGHIKDTIYDYNPSRAVELLAEYRMEYPEKELKLSISTNSQYVDLCEFIQKEWQQLGFEVEVDLLPPSTLKQAKATGKLSLFRASWIADYPDGENYLSLFLSGNFAPNGPNYTHFSDLDYDSMYMDSQSEIKPIKRAEIYTEMDKKIMEQAPVILLYYDQVVRMVPKKLKNMRINGVNQLNLEEVYLD